MIDVIIVVKKQLTKEFKMQSNNREKMNPGMASKKGVHPTWNSVEESRHHWRKTFYIEGKITGKVVKKKRRKFSRETIRLK